MAATAQDVARRDRYFAELTELLAECSPAEAGAQSSQAQRSDSCSAVVGPSGAWTPASAGEQEGAETTDLDSIPIPSKDAPND